MKKSLVNIKAPYFSSISSALLLAACMAMPAQAGPLIMATASIGCSSIPNGVLKYKQSIIATHAYGASGQFYQNTKLTVLNGAASVWSTSNTAGNVNHAIALTPGVTYSFLFTGPSNSALATLHAVARACPKIIINKGGASVK